VDLKPYEFNYCIWKWEYIDISLSGVSPSENTSLTFHALFSPSINPCDLSDTQAAKHLHGVSNIIFLLQRKVTNFVCSTEHLEQIQQRRPCNHFFVSCKTLLIYRSPPLRIITDEPLEHILYPEMFREPRISHYLVWRSIVIRKRCFTEVVRNRPTGRLVSSADGFRFQTERYRVGIPLCVWVSSAVLYVVPIVVWWLRLSDRLISHGVVHIIRYLRISKPSNKKHEHFISTKIVSGSAEIDTFC